MHYRILALAVLTIASAATPAFSADRFLFEDTALIPYPVLTVNGSGATTGRTNCVLPEYGTHQFLYGDNSYWFVMNGRIPRRVYRTDMTGVVQSYVDVSLPAYSWNGVTGEKVTYGNGYLWFVLPLNPRKILKVNPTTGVIVATMDVALPVSQTNGENIAFGDGWLWFLVQTMPRILYRVNPDTGVAAPPMQVNLPSYYTDGENLAAGNGKIFFSPRSFSVIPRTVYVMPNSGGAIQTITCTLPIYGPENFAYLPDNMPSTPSWFNSTTWAIRQGGFWDAQKWMPGDFNGDGKADLANVFYDNGLASIDMHQSNGTSVGIVRWANRQGGFWDLQKWLPGDFNGDGKCDLVNIFNDSGLASIDVHPSNGTSFGIARWATRQGSFLDGQKWLAGDFNGDGKCDLVSVFDDGGFASIDMHPSNGASFSTVRWVTRQGGFVSSQKWLAGDFNGDGKCDLVKIFNDNGSASIDLYSSNGTSFSITRWATQQGIFADSQKWLPADFNGDGKVDLICVTNSSGLASIDVHLSQGGHFDPSHSGDLQGGFWDAQQWFSGDFNGDGFTDIGKVFNDAGSATIGVHLAVPFIAMPGGSG